MNKVQILGINITVCLVLALYLLYLSYLDYTNNTGKLPTIVRDVLNNFFVRLALMALIAATALGYNKLGGLQIAILMAAAYLLTMSMVHKDQITENFIEKLSNVNDDKEELTNEDGDGNGDGDNDDDKHYNKVEADDKNAKNVLAQAFTKCDNMKDKSDACDNLITTTNTARVPIIDKMCTQSGLSGPDEGFCKEVYKQAQKVKSSTDSSNNEPNQDNQDDTKESFNNPIGQAYLETMGAEPVSQPYASLESAF